MQHLNPRDPLAMRRLLLFEDVQRLNVGPQRGNLATEVAQHSVDGHQPSVRRDRATTMPSSIRLSQRTYFFAAKIDSTTMGRPSVGISVQRAGGDVYRVVVTQGRDETRHDVTVTAEDVARYAPGSTPERLLEASFEFLLEREPASSILPRFALPVIERYFPEYARVIGQLFNR